MPALVADHYGPTVHSLTRPNHRAQGVRLRWLGQAGFAVETSRARILIDPYLSDSLAAKYRGTLFPHERLHPAPIEPERLVDVTAVLHTHGHTDHLDPWTVHGILANNRPRFVAPRARAELAVERGIPAELLIPAADGDVIELADGIAVEALPAAHEALETDANGDHLHLGYILCVGGVRIYHSGDCIPYEGLAERLRAASVDIALLPINGRDDYRTSNGVPGNFTVAEALDLARRAEIPALVGHHYGLFDFNTIDPADARAELERTAADLDWTLPSLGLGYRIPAATTLPVRRAHHTDHSHRTHQETSRA